MDTMSLSSLITLWCIWSGPGALDMFSFFRFFLTVSASMWRSSIWQYSFISVLSLLVSVEKTDVK